MSSRVRGVDCSHRATTAVVMFEILMTADDIDRSERMALVGSSLDARMLMWAQLRKIRQTIGGAVEMRETAFVDEAGALCEGVEWVMEHPERGWSSLFKLYFRELATRATDSTDDSST